MFVISIRGESLFFLNFLLDQKVTIPIYFGTRQK